MQKPILDEASDALKALGINPKNNATLLAAFALAIATERNAEATRELARATRSKRA